VARISAGVVAVVIDHGDVIDDALDVKNGGPTPAKLEEAFADSGPPGTFKYSATAAAAAGVANVVHTRRVRKLETSRDLRPCK